MGEKYSGTKFNTIFKGSFKPNKEESKKIEDLINLGQYLGKMGFEDDNGGNFSFKTKKGIIIKTTGAFPHKLKKSDFVLVSSFQADDVYVYGEKEPSSEARLHWEIYQARPDINYVIHTHDFTAVNCPEKINSVVYIPELPYGSIELAKAVKNASKKGDYLLIENHGIVSLAESIPKALKLIEKYHEKFKQIKKEFTSNCRA
jgi:L-fuculose-phosphate aldolase